MFTNVRMNTYIHTGRWTKDLDTFQLFKGVKMLLRRLNKYSLPLNQYCNNIDKIYIISETHIKLKKISEIANSNYLDSPK